MEREIKTPIFFLSSALILGLFFSFYQIPLILLFLAFLGIFFYLFFKKNFLKPLFLWIFCILGFYLIGKIYFSKVNKYSIQEENFTILTKIKKVEPYYQGYLNTAYNYDLGNFIFKTDKIYFSPGEVCLIKFKRTSFSEYINPFYVEREKRLLVKGQFLELTPVKKEDWICEKRKEFTLENLRYQVFRFSEKLSSNARGLIQALVLGVEYNIPEEYKDKLKNQGLYHQLAISGFNLAVLFGLLYKFWYNFLKFTPFIKIGYPLQNISHLLSLPGAFIILLFSGFCPSAFRAFVFLLLYVLNKLFFRSASTLNLLFLTITLILIFQPYLIGNLSFQLSFIATLGLIIGDKIFNANLKELIKFKNSWLIILNKIFYLFLLSFIVSILVFPFIIYINGTFPLLTPVNNVLATFFWSLIFIPLSISISIISFFHENFAIYLADILDSIFNWYIKIPFFEIVYKINIPFNLMIFFLIFCIITFLIFYNYGKNYTKYLLWILICFLFYICFYYFYLNTFYILIFDVGRGNCILIKNKSNYILIDTGPNYFQNFNWTKTYLSPILNKLGVDIIEEIIISHPDLDHSGGLKTLKEEFFVKKVISGNFYVEDWEKVNTLFLPEIIDNPISFKIKETELFIFPGNIPYEDLNRESLVVYLEYKGLTVLFSGDIDKIRFYRMKENNQILPVEILISPHHGSKYSINEEILTWLNPKVIITSGRGIYFPHPDYLKILSKFNKSHFGTNEKGAIFVFPKKDYFLICFEKDRKKDFLASFLFPLIPAFLEKGDFCKSFGYHKEY